MDIVGIARDTTVTGYNIFSTAAGGGWPHAHATPTPNATRNRERQRIAVKRP
ncbi:MAG: hypothetical protein SOV37_02955 [Candidatus Borkfalkiaceae bacterium]|nr:hypothetical protein [Christensenellaceae bacterium]